MKEIKLKIAKAEQKLDMNMIMQVWNGWGEVQEPLFIAQKEYRGSSKSHKRGPRAPENGKGRV